MRTPLLHPLVRLVEAALKNAKSARGRRFFRGLLRGEIYHSEQQGVAKPATRTRSPHGKKPRKARKAPTPIKPGRKRGS